MFVLVSPVRSSSNSPRILSPRSGRLLVYLIEKFDLGVAGPWLHSQADFCYNNTLFMVPSLANSLSNIPLRLKLEGYVGVVFDFPDGFLPRCVFYQLLTKIMKWYLSEGFTVNR